MATAAIAGASMGLSAAGALIQGQGAQEAANAQAQAYQYKAGVALLNKQINDQNANWAFQAGQTQAEESGMKSRSQIAQTKVAQAASGLDVNSGTGEAVREAQTQVAAFNQNVISWDAAKTAYGYETKATMDVAESQLDTMAAQQSEIAGQYAVESAWINTATNVASKWSQASMSGMIPTG